jgi:hypothetical protein
MPNNVLFAPDLSMAAKCLYAILLSFAWQEDECYRPARFNNRKRPKGWLPPTIKAKADCVIGWVEKLMRLCPIAAISLVNSQKISEWQGRGKNLNP